MDSVIAIDSHVPGLGRFTTSSLALCATVLLLVLTKIVYTHIKHPLHRFPGPFSAAWSNALHSYTFLGGRQPYKILALHERYGPVVRTSPNELSFSSAGSWRDIYGFRQGHKPFIKSEFYDGGSFADQAHSIVSERDPVVHGRMRKYLSRAFSDKSLKEQEYLVAEIVDLFVEQVGKYGSEEKGIDMVMWFNLLTFDIIGSLAFGEPFGGLECAKFHSWIGLVTKALRQGALADSFNRFPYFAKIFKTLMSGAIDTLIKDTRTHQAQTMSLVKKRVNKTSDRPDFLTRILESRDQDDISDVQIAAHSSDFVTAGSETTATCLSCVTYYLRKNPDVCRKLQEEVRSAFKSYDEITANRTSSLKYLNAVCLEGMRIYPPLPFALPRVVPGGGDTVDGHYLPAGTIVSANPVAASLSSATHLCHFLIGTMTQSSQEFPPILQSRSVLLTWWHGWFRPGHDRVIEKGHVRSGDGPNPFLSPKSRSPAALSQIEVLGNEPARRCMTAGTFDTLMRVSVPRTKVNPFFAKITLKIQPF